MRTPCHEASHWNIYVLTSGARPAPGAGCRVGGKFCRLLPGVNHTGSPLGHTGRARGPVTEAPKSMRILASNAPARVANTQAARRTGSGGFSIDETATPQSAKPAATIRTIGG